MSNYCWHATDLVRFGFIMRDSLIRGTRDSKYRPSGATDPVWWSSKHAIDVTASAHQSRRDGIPTVIIQIEQDKTMPFSLDNLKTHFKWTDEDCAILMNNPLTKNADTSEWRISHDVPINQETANFAIIAPNGKMINEPFATVVVGEHVLVEAGKYAFSANQIRSEDGRLGYGINVSEPMLVKRATRTNHPPSAMSRQERRAMERREAKQSKHN